MSKSKLRFVYMTLVGIMFVLIGEIFKPKGIRDENILLKFLIAIIVTIIIWEGNRRIDHWLNIHYPWLKETRKRLYIQILVSPLFTTGTLFLLRFLTHILIPDHHQNPGHRFDPLFMPALFLAILILAIDSSYQFLRAWKKSMLDVEKYRAESAEAQLQNLKNQINPHFLFNNLSVLSSLIYIDQEKAINFIKELSKVYRYVLDTKNAELVSLEEELEFLENYIYLMKIRFEDAVNFSINIAELNKNDYLPPMCLQLLVENALQHNEASKDNPLNISVCITKNKLTIENNIQPRIDKVESSKTGMKNIQSRYAYFSNEKIEISNNEIFFKVSLPLMSKK